MTTSSDPIERATEFVGIHLQQNSPAWAVFHTLEHTMETVEAAREIAEGSKLNKSETEIVLLAACLHGSGYAGQPEGPESRSAEIARTYLSSQGYPPEKVDAVVRCILATRVPRHPVDILEQVVCDAVQRYLGRKKFFKKNRLLRTEIESRLQTSMTESEWLKWSMELFSSGRFYTDYARAEFGPRFRKNAIRLHEELRRVSIAAEQELEEKGQRQDKMKLKLEKATRPERGIETMFRVVPKNHLDLTGMADSKAHMMISTNSIIVSLVVALLLRHLASNPHLLFPIIVIFIVSMTAIIFAILATRPKITKGKFTRDDIESKRANLLFFGNYHDMSLEDFEWGMNKMMGDRDYLYSSMIRDLHSLGQVLATKYRYLRISFDVFMYGFIVAVIIFLYTVLMYPTDLS